MTPAGAVSPEPRCPMPDALHRLANSSEMRDNLRVRVGLRVDSRWLEDWTAWCV